MILPRTTSSARVSCAKPAPHRLLDHPNICTIHEFGETPEGELFIAMAYCPGEDLRIAPGPTARFP